MWPWVFSLVVSFVGLGQTVHSVRRLLDKRTGSIRSSVLPLTDALASLLQLASDSIDPPSGAVLAFAAHVGEFLPLCENNNVTRCGW